MFKSCVAVLVVVLCGLSVPAVAAEGEPFVIKFAHVVADDTPKGKGHCCSRSWPMSAWPAR